MANELTFGGNGANPYVVPPQGGCTVSLQPSGGVDISPAAAFYAVGAPNSVPPSTEPDGTSNWKQILSTGTQVQISDGYWLYLVVQYAPSPYPLFGSLPVPLNSQNSEANIQFGFTQPPLPPSNVTIEVKYVSGGSTED